MKEEKIKQLLITGRKGGGDDEPDPPVEEPNTLQSKSIAEFVYLLCEGEISGPANSDEMPVQGLAAAPSPPLEGTPRKP